MYIYICIYIYVCIYIYIFGDGVELHEDPHYKSGCNVQAANDQRLNKFLPLLASKFGDTLKLSQVWDDRRYRGKHGRTCLWPIELLPGH